jgi:ribosomal-protein-alanine N-acetyltransferase
LFRYVYRTIYNDINRVWGTCQVREKIPFPEEQALLDKRENRITIRRRRCAMKIRKAKKSDINAITSLTVRAWKGATVAEAMEKKHGLVQGRRWYAYKSADLRDFCRQHLRRVFVAEEDGRIVGYATYNISLQRKIGTVGNNAVDPDFRGRGIGSALHKTVLAQLKKEGMILAFVSTLAHDEPAQRLYERHGFTELCRSIHYMKKL